MLAPLTAVRFHGPIEFDFQETQMRILAAFLVAAMSTTVSLAQEPIKLSGADRALVVREVVDYFKQHPDELVEAIVKWRESNSDEIVKAQTADTLPDPTTGRADAPVTIIEFGDYGCAECNGVSSVLDAVALADKDVRLMHRDFPRSNIDAVQASLDLISAASKGGDWHAMRRLYLIEGVAPETRIKALAASGAQVTNEDRAKASETLTKSKTLAEKAGVTTLPAVIVVVGSKVQALTGPQTKDSVLAAIASVRKAAGQ